MSFFQHYYLYTSDHLRKLRRKQIATVVMQLSCLLTYCCLVLPVIWIALVLHLGHSTGGARVLIWTCWGLRSGLLRHGLNFSTAWCTTRLISIEKTGRMHPCRRWSLRTLTATVLAWHSSCHTPQPVLFRATNVWRNTENLQSDVKV